MLLIYLTLTFIEKTPKISSQPCLGFILVGGREDSALYVKMKKKSCSDIGIKIKGKARLPYEF